MKFGKVDRGDYSMDGGRKKEVPALCGYLLCKCQRHLLFDATLGCTLDDALGEDQVDYYQRDDGYTNHHVDFSHVELCVVSVAELGDEDRDGLFGIRVDNQGRGKVVVS